MCNACGNVCCGSDEFGGCGCDGCHDSDCWTPGDDFFDDDDGYHEAAYGYDACTCRARPAVYACTAFPP